MLSPATFCTTQVYVPSSSSVTLLMTSVWWLKDIREFGRISFWFFFHVVRTLSSFSASQSNRMFWPERTVASFGSMRNRGSPVNTKMARVRHSLNKTGSENSYSAIMMRKEWVRGAILLTVPEVPECWTIRLLFRGKWGKEWGMGDVFLIKLRENNILPQNLLLNEKNERNKALQIWIQNACLTWRAVSCLWIQVTNAKT